jgi:predicted GIY-YIG superfamily endonuclease
MTRTALYRIFDTGGELAYIGIAQNVMARLADHERLSAWYSGNVGNVAIEWFTSREHAARAEIAAIKAESPRENDIHKPKVDRLSPDAPAVRGMSQTTPAEWQRLADMGLSPMQAAAQVGKTPAAARKAAQVYGISFTRGKRNALPATSEATP